MVRQREQSKRKSKKLKPKAEASKRAKRISYEAALYAIRSAQEHDSYIAREVLDTFLYGDSRESLIEAINKLHHTFQMEDGDRKGTLDANYFLQRAIAFDRARPFASANSAIAYTLAAYAEEWDEKNRKADELLKRDPEHEWAVEWKNKKGSRWDYAWEQARTHDDVSREWRRVKRRLTGLPKLFKIWKREVTNLARSIDSRK